MLLHRRVTLSLDLTTATPSAPPSDRFKIRPMEGAVGAEVFDGDVVIAHCHEDMVVGDRVEVGVWTDPRFRRQGLARLALAAAIKTAQSRGLKRMGWHCLASNRGSLGVARTGGFSVEAEYEAFGAYLTAESRADLDAAEWTALAVHFGRGAAQIPLLGLYAAEAWTNSGRLDDALAALEGLVETDGNARSEWLEQSWSLEPLRGEPRFARILARQREKESLKRSV